MMKLLRKFVIPVLFMATTAGQAQFSYTTNADGITLTITGYNGTNTVVTVSTNINGLTVTGIGNGEYSVFPDTVTSITIPDGVTSIGGVAFYQCYSLASVTIPASITSVGDNAFNGCTRLTSVTIPGSVNSIGESAFNDCTSLTNATIGNGVTNIEEDAFGGCTSLTSVTIPASVTNIADYAFNQCQNLTSVYFEGDSPNADSTIFNSDNNATVYYSLGTTGWSSTFGGRPVLLMSPFTIQPQSQIANAGATVTFFCGTILQQVSFQWQKNSTNLANGGNISGATNSTLTITGISDSDAASYSVIISNAGGSVLSSIATLTVIDPPSITAQPTNLLVLTGSSATFGVSLIGSPPLFQWQFNSANLLNATNATYTISLVSTNEGGYYAVIVSNQAGTMTSSDAALVVVLSPSSRTNYASSTATFTVTAFSPESLNYQWQKNGTSLANGGNISGATSSTLTVANISDADAANYSAVVSDAHSSVTTSNATLTVNDSLVFAAQALSQKVGAGSMVTFTATAYGVPPFVFQWSFNQTPVGSPTTGTNVSSYSLANVKTNQTGNYAVEVFNGSGSLTSSNAVLTVIAQPKLSLEMLAGYPILSLYGTPGNSFMVEYNTNLASTNWINLLLINLSANPYQFLDPSGIGQPARFYRAFFTQ